MGSEDTLSSEPIVLLMSIYIYSHSIVEGGFDDMS